MQLSYFFRVTFCVSACFSSLLYAPVPSDQKDKKSMESRSAVPSKIAVVDIRRLITQDPELLKQAAAEWQDLFAKIQETLKPDEKDIRELEETAKNLEKSYRKKIAEIESLQKSGISSKETLRKKYEEEIAPLEYELQNKSQKLQTLAQQYQRFSYDELGKAQAAIGPKIEKAIDSVCDIHGWDFAMSREAIPSRRLAKRFDITEDVLLLLNKQYAEEKAKKEAEKPKAVEPSQTVRLPQG